VELGGTALEKDAALGLISVQLGYLLLVDP
jgi:hypothetical protein